MKKTLLDGVIKKKYEHKSETRAKKADPRMAQ